MNETRERLITEIPEELIRSATEHLWQFTVGFVRVERKGKVEEATLLGSGILVKANGRYACLTAAHVIDVLPRSGRVGLILSAKAEQTTIAVSGIAYLKIDRGQDPKAGPDIAAVVLSSPVASAVASKKTFYTLDIQKERLTTAPPDDREGIWIASGFVEEFTLVDPNPAPYETVKAFCEFGSVGGVESYIIQGEHDYFVFPLVPQADSSIPHNFGGVSGSGLWHVLLREKEGGVLAADQYILQGLTYYQDPYVEGRSALRCHGQRSVYRVAYAALCRAAL